MKKLLIAENSEVITKTLVQALRECYDVHICHTGGDALKLLNDLRPDVLIINLCLHDTDGLTVLRNTQYIPPTVQALTYILDDTAVQIAKSYGVGGIILLPCTIQAIVDQLEKLTHI